jgi:acetyl esterase/lipase
MTEKHTASLNIIPLYPDAAPGSEDWNYPEVEETPAPPAGIGGVRNVTRPVLIPYLPDPKSANGIAIIVCPGGAFHGLAIYHEGHDVARWLQARGVAAFVLKYRVVHTIADPEEYARKMLELRALPPEENERHIESVTREVRSLAIADGLQAVKLVRERAAEWNFRPNRIGIMGFSAGGHVAAYVALNYEAANRPDFAGVIYGALAKDIQVPHDAPPLFMALTNNDGIAVEPSLELYSAWNHAGHPVELHIYAHGDHGFGMIPHNLPADGWIERFWEWLQGTLKSDAPEIQP